jgi:hypothetical protein
MTNDNEYFIPDDDRVVHFFGRLLGYASSEEPNKTRWSEIAVYETREGNFVVAGVGVSTVDNEVNWHWAQVCSEAQCVVERLRLNDDDGGWYIPRTSRRALQLASQENERIKLAYTREEVG